MSEALGPREQLTNKNSNKKRFISRSGLGKARTMQRRVNASVKDELRRVFATQYVRGVTLYPNHNLLSKSLLDLVE